MNTLKYKGYIGSVAYSEPDKVFFGKLEGIDALVNYEGESVAELTASFHEAVDDYLAFCQDLGQKPEKSYTGTFNVRISPATHRDIANRASEAGISINAFVKKALDEAVKEPEAPVYGSRTSIKLRIPNKDSALVKELASRMGWELE